VNGGVAVTVAPVVPLNPVEGDHTYPGEGPDEEAVKETLSPEQIVEEEGETEIVGCAFTVTVTGIRLLVQEPSVASI